MKMSRAIAAIVVVLYAITSASAAEAQYTAAGSSMTLTESTLRPGDVIRISVWPNADLSGEFAVEETGNVYLPMIGAVQTAGMSIDDLRMQLRDNYRVYVNNAVVTVTPAFSVGVLGEVQRPGLYVVTATNTLFDVIAMAGGFRPTADEERVRVVREGQVVEVDAIRALRQGEGLASLALHSGDQIIVDRRRTIGLEQMRSVLTLLQSVVLAATLVERMR